MPSTRTARTPRLFLALALAPALWLAGCAAAPEAPAAPVAVVPAAPPKPYMHMTRLGDDAYAARMCIREFQPVSGHGPAVFLAGAIHIGEPAYYEELQKHLDAQEIVLFEGVRSRDAEANEKKKEARAKGKGGDTYGRLAKALGLVPQMGHIAYDRKHFRNADLTIEEVRENLERAAKEPGEAGEAARAALQQFAMVENFILKDNPLMALLLWGVERHAGTRARLRLTMVAKDDASDGGGDGAMSARLMETIIEERNDAALAELAKVLRESPAARSISIFYGAAHLKDMEEKLVRDFGYRPVRSQWITSMTVHPLAEGLTRAEVDEVLGKKK